MFIDLKELRERTSKENSLIERLKVENKSEPSPEIKNFDPKKFNQSGIVRENWLDPSEANEKRETSLNERALIGATSLAIGSPKTAEIFGISKQYASMLSRGQMNGNTHGNPEEREKYNQELKDRIYEGLAAIRDKARAKLLMALEGIDEAALENIPIKDRAAKLANVANQLSSVIDRTINKGEHLTDGRSSHLHLYAPESRPLAAFTIKRVGDDATATSSGE